MLYILYTARLLLKNGIDMKILLITIATKVEGTGRSTILLASYVGELGQYTYYAVSLFFTLFWASNAILEVNYYTR